jgi:hypothetical protein
MDKFMFTDSSGKKSLTATVFVTGSFVVFFKLLVSGLTISGFTMAPFSGSEFGLAMAALGSIYVLRRHPALSNKDSKE